MIGTPDKHNVTLNFMVYNPRSIVNKVRNIMMTFNDKNIDIGAICESWLTEKNCPTTAIIKQFGHSVIHDFRVD